MKRKPLKRKASPVPMWAVVVRSKRSEWIYWGSIAGTKKQAFEIYCLHHFSHLNPFDVAGEIKRGDIRLARVVVSLQ